MNRLDSRIRIVWAVRVLVLVLGVLVIGLGSSRIFEWVPVWVGPVASALLAVIGIVGVELRYRVWRYAVEDDALVIIRGVVTRVNAAVPYVRIQHVDTQRGPLERALGLSSVVVYTAGRRGADVTIPGLSTGDATALQDRLRSLAAASEAADAV